MCTPSIPPTATSKTKAFHVTWMRIMAPFMRLMWNILGFVQYTPSVTLLLCHPSRSASPVIRSTKSMMLMWNENNSDKIIALRDRAIPLGRIVIWRYNREPWVLFGCYKEFCTLTDAKFSMPVKSKPAFENDMYLVPFLITVRANPFKLFLIHRFWSTGFWKSLFAKILYEFFI